MSKLIFFVYYFDFRHDSNVFPVRIYSRHMGSSKNNGLGFPHSGHLQFRKLLQYSIVATNSVQINRRQHVSTNISSPTFEYLI